MDKIKKSCQFGYRYIGGGQWKLVKRGKWGHRRCPSPPKRFKGTAPK